MKFVVFLRECALIPVRLENSGFYNNRREKTKKLKSDQYNLKYFFYLMCGNRFCFKCFWFLIYRLKQSLLCSTKGFVFFRVVLLPFVKSFYYFWSSLFSRLYLSGLSFEVKMASLTKAGIQTKRKTSSRIGVKYLFFCASFFLCLYPYIAAAETVAYEMCEKKKKIMVDIGLVTRCVHVRVARHWKR